MDHNHKILIIKQGALGDLITATGAFSVIRDHFPTAQLILLTEERFEKLAQKMGYFDRVICQERSKNIFKILRFCRRLKKEGFSFIFDLQNSHRTSLYHFFLGPFRRPHWSGIAPGCSHPQTRRDRTLLPAASRFADQLSQAGLDLKGRSALEPDLSWMTADLSHLSLQTPSSQAPSLQPPFALVIPGSSLSGAYKRWPASSYATLAQWLLNKGIQPVLIAGPEDTEPADIMRAQVPGLCDLSLKVTLFEIAALARQARVVIGNDTGPTLIAAGVGAPTFFLWSGASDPDVYAPRGPKVQVLFEETLEDLCVDRVCAALEACLRPEQTLRPETETRV